MGYNSNTIIIFIHWMTFQKVRSVLCGISIAVALHCPGCEWYGQVYCSGDVIIDLYRWWFKANFKP